ncbi:hypothetical protein H311_03467 [Anncaliia algerae PRA109]|nr:hypothetical protein H311_03467 [Anncaliia algerae PRA109]
MIKSIFYVQRQRDNNLSIRDAVSIVIKQENYHEHCIRFYHHMREWLKKARRKEQFI